MKRVFYRDGKTVVTSFYAIRDADSLIVRDYKGGAWHPISVAPDQQNGFAVLRLGEGIGHKGLMPSNRSRVGEPVVVVGDPREVPPSICRGKVSGLNASKRVPVLRTTVEVATGSLGGPALDTQGQVLGVIGVLQDWKMVVGVKAIDAYIARAPFLGVGEWLAT